DHGKSLFRSTPEPAENADLIFSRCQPIGSLAKIAEISEIHFPAVEAFKKLWSDLRMMVHKKQCRRYVVGARPQSDCFAFPFGIEKIPHRADRFQTNEFGVRIKRRPIKRALVDKDVLPLGVDVAVLALPPFGKIGHLGQDQRRRQWIESLTAVKAIVGGARRAKHDVD